jgi:hypothetical protein
MGGGGQSSLITDAAMVRVDVYGANGHCADGMLVAGSGSPILSRTYAQGQPISLDVPPGPHAIVLSTFADSDGQQLLGVGCTEADLSAGSQICFDLTLVPGPDGGDDLSGAACSTAPDDCPNGSYCNGLNCVPGCKADTDCPKTDAGLGTCDKTMHTCEDCVADTDCGSAAGATCCNKHCTNVKTDPLHCGSCTNACTGANTACCNAVCSNPTSDSNNCGSCGNVCSTLNATMATCGGSMCSWACSPGYAHCMAGNTGCDTNLGGSGKKLCGTTCVATSSCCSSMECMTPPAPTACYNTAGTCSGVGGTCTYSLKTAGSKVCGSTCCNAYNGTCNANCTLACTSGYADCDGDPSNGCETNLASAGKKLCGTVCIAASGCCNATLDCTTPMPPAACYATPGTCPVIGGSCNYAVKGGSVICGTTCCNAINGTCNANCTLNCTAGTGDCDSNPANGCEDNTNTDPAHCGSCANTCNLPHTATDGCSGGNCTVGTCSAGFYDCDGVASNGCESPGPSSGFGCCSGTSPAATGTPMIAHGNGYGGTFYDCYPKGTPGNQNTYFSTMGLDAAASYTTQPGTASDNWNCGNGTSRVTSICKSVDPTGKTGTCTCWAYTCGNCTTPPCSCTAGAMAVIGHTFSNTQAAPNDGCLCQLATDPTWGN